MHPTPKYFFAKIIHFTHCASLLLCLLINSWIAFTGYQWDAVKLILNGILPISSTHWLHTRKTACIRFAIESIPKRRTDNDPFNQGHFWRRKTYISISVYFQFNGQFFPFWDVCLTCLFVNLALYISFNIPGNMFWWSSHPWKWNLCWTSTAPAKSTESSCYC